METYIIYADLVIQAMTNRYQAVAHWSAVAILSSYSGVDRHWGSILGLQTKLSWTSNKFMYGYCVAIQLLKWSGSQTNVKGGKKRER